MVDHLSNAIHKQLPMITKQEEMLAGKSASECWEAKFRVHIEMQLRQLKVL